jgi:2,5-diketo-D-gluconate reductase A
MSATQSTSPVPTVRLNDGRAIPQLGFGAAFPQLDLGETFPRLGFGAFQIAPGETARAVSQALEIGYRHIDTAQMYGNEREVGDAIRASGLDRAEVFITSKLNNGSHRPDDARRAFDQTLTELGFDYVDLFLIHWPLPTLYGGDFVSTWKTLQEFKRQDRARSIGVSNFQVPHLQRLARETEVTPAVNQIELHPYLLNDIVRRYGHEHGIATEAWSPIAQGRVLDDPAITQIADRLGRTPAQVVLRWHIQLGHIVFPKSTTPPRIEENFQLFDFELDSGDADKITGLDKGEAGRIGPHPDTFEPSPTDGANYPADTE